MSTDRPTLKAALQDADFPASKEQLIEQAEQAGADQETLRALRSIPPADYENYTEVARSVPFSRASEDEESDPEKAKRARAGKDRLAEHQTETPANPIVEELGENRGS
ncbi:DUF2795 domain-containing protein [Saccharopolyspora rectivirgula]|jgi:hypothetical protein|uniref:DUF2795 domain-containing protein n=1 Tax=Saccharopolyspora rectivirgula TaxID=28042 RepID=A0A073BCX9_9PSEU|nr:DUF2795 domain-containing protein [Saccharopolyspora rectivirgula]KEI45594.1 hypothetical protein GU90_03970 [Saccharopolyspora rectivirgula]